MSTNTTPAPRRLSQAERKVYSHIWTADPTVTTGQQRRATHDQCRRIERLIIDLPPGAHRLFSFQRAIVARVLFFANDWQDCQLSATTDSQRAKIRAHRFTAGFITAAQRHIAHNAAGAREIDPDRQIFARLQAEAAEEEHRAALSRIKAPHLPAWLDGAVSRAGAQQIRPLRQLAKESRRRHANYEEIARDAAQIVNLHESLILSAAATPDTDD